jgi:nitroimidazol reductase NimA-like FMN-containing flavoprotein (pyridoxamine 5'-phosphate oxidase superfamily)
MNTQAWPALRELDRAECEALLARNQVGRIAFSFRDHVDIQPMHYAYADGWIYGRTSPGSKLTTLAHHRWVAFEVDEVEGAFDWRSVVAHGAVYIITPDSAHAQHAPRALALLRGVIPETFTERDPVPFRDVLLGIHVDALRGRVASTAGGRREATVAANASG